jgi:arsenical pump membrane protein
VSGGLGEALGVALLAASLAVAVIRPRWLPEATGAVPAALLVVVLGVLPLTDALDEVRALAPTVGFLAAVLVLADLCEREGLFTAAGARLVSASGGRPVPFLGQVFVLGSAVTAVLSLDATVVLLTPVVMDAAVRSRLRPKPPVYACSHLANTASLLLPVSNLTNLLAFRASGLSFVRCARHGAAARTAPRDHPRKRSRAAHDSAADPNPTSATHSPSRTATQRSTCPVSRCPSQ